MGLHGALVVRPADRRPGLRRRRTAYDDEAVLVLSEIDPALNNAANPAAFDMRKFAPRYFLINGKVYPNTDADRHARPATAVLLRYVNAGVQYHSMGVLGAGQTVVAIDGSPLAHARRYVAETFGPGQTADAIVDGAGCGVDVASLSSTTPACCCTTPTPRRVRRHAHRSRWHRTRCPPGRRPGRSVSVAASRRRP